MTTVFVGGSRHVSRLSSEVVDRLQNVVTSGATVIVGDANGADKAVQKFLAKSLYRDVTVFCSGDSCRNNLGPWETRNIETSPNAQGFAFYAAKDRQMAREADFGLMIWDGKSPGTILNILRLVRAGKKAVLMNVHDKTTVTFKTPDDWDRFTSELGATLLTDLQKRATPDEWMSAELAPQSDLLDPLSGAPHQPEESFSSPLTDDQATAEINAALDRGDPALVVGTLGSVAKAQGMGRIAKDTGLARESLYRSLSPNGNPEFATVFRVLSAMGLRLTVRKARDREPR